jgi:hypothetical protein
VGGDLTDDPKLDHGKRDQVNRVSKILFKTGFSTPKVTTQTLHYDE